MNTSPGARARTTALEVLERVGLASRANSPASALTLAGKKRLEVARALAARPKLLLLDEVLAGLNPTEIALMIDLVRSIRDSGVSVFMIEHVMQAIMNLSDRIVVLNLGRKIAEAPPTEVVQNPDVVEAYLGFPDIVDKLRGRRMSDVALELQNIESGYGEVQVLWGISLKARAGKLTTIIGANGAGKTTALRTTMGSVRPWRGRVVLNGEDVTKLPPHAKAGRGLVLVPEGRQLFPDMSVAENLEMGAYSRRARPRQKQNLERVYQAFPRLQERSQAEVLDALRRRTADGRPRPRTDAGTRRPHD